MLGVLCWSNCSHMLKLLGLSCSPPDWRWRRRSELTLLLQVRPVSITYSTKPLLWSRVVRQQRRMCV